MLYVYGLSKESEDKGTKGLQHFFVVEADYASDEEYVIHPETPKWKKYSQRLREIVREYNSNKVNIADDIV